MLGSLGMPELVVIAVVVLLIFGPKKLPGLARGLGESIKEFKKAGKELQDTVNEAHDRD
jgi:sec-independent protein translocase protein TatA